MQRWLVWGSQYAQTNQYPEREDHGLGHGILGPCGRDEAGIDGLEAQHTGLHAAAGLDHRQQYHDGSHSHDDALHGIGKDNGTEPAQRGIGDNRDAEERQPDFIRVAGDGLEQAGTADELGCHGSHEKDQQGQRAKDGHGVTAIADAQVIGDGHGVHGPGFHGEAFAQDPDGQEDGGHLDHGQQDPAQTHGIGHPRPADETAGTGVAGHHGHGQHKAAHGTAAQKVFLKEARRVLMFTGKFSGPQGHHKGKRQIKDDGEQRGGSSRHGRSSRPGWFSEEGAPDACDASSSSRGMSLKTKRTSPQTSRQATG